MSCDEMLDVVDQVAAGDLTPTPDAAAHLASCAACAAALEQARALERMLQARPVPKAPAQFTSRTTGRIRRDRWRREQIFDTGFNVALALVVVAIVGGVWLLMHRSGLIAVSNDAVGLIGTAVTTLVRRLAPAVPLYAGAAALLASALGIWWWAERDITLNWLSCKVTWLICKDQGQNSPTEKSAIRQLAIHQLTNSPTHQLRPLLKWAGGKRQLLPELRRFYPARFNRYIEPFLGSGAVFFDLHGAGRLRGQDVVLIDSNADLIGCYEAVRDRTEEVARELDEHARRTPRRAARTITTCATDVSTLIGNACGVPTAASSTRRRSRRCSSISNRTGFNGLFRLNARGAFNVPAGRYDRPRISSRDQLSRVADAMAAPGVRLSLGSFESARELADADDFVYCDPPYAPLSATANFTSYTALRFDRGDQRRLQAVVVELARRGCHVLVSNSTAKEIAELYDTNVEARDAGLRAHRVAARRAINSNAARRGPVFEFLITNGTAGDHAAS